MTAHRRNPHHIARTLILLTAAAALAVGTFFIGRWTAPLRTSQRASSASPPPVAVTVVRRQITLTVDITATVAPATETLIPLLAPQDVARTVVTATPHGVGTKVSAGQMLLAVSGRPIFALPGLTPAYRNLATGDSGPDVKQLQTALHELGYKPDSDGTFHADTNTALIAFYADRGYSAIQPTPKTVSVPASELAFMPHLPALLAAQPVSLGADPTGKSLVVDATTPGAVTAQLNSASSSIAPAHTPVLLQCSGLTVRGTLGPAQAANSATGPADSAAPNTAPSADLVSRPVTPTKPIPTSVIGAVCAGTATVAITNTPVLAVPAAAIYDTANQGTVVHVRANGTTSTIAITTGRSGGGWVELTTPPASITAGTVLLIGS